MSDLTDTAAWKRGTAAAVEAMANAELRNDPPDVRATSRWKPSTEELVFCAEPDCGLTLVADNSGPDLCWAHKTVETLKKEGTL